MPNEFFRGGSGSKIWDISGREYIDYLLGQGPLVLGHAPSDVNTAVYEATSRGTVFGAQNAVEVEASELIIAALGWPEQVRLAMTGTEAVQAALRLARAYTNRTKVVRFEGHYHGWVDTVLIGGPAGSWLPPSAGQSKAAQVDLIVVPWNDGELVRAVFDQHSSEIAAVITEPFMLNTGGIQPLPGYLELLRSLCDSSGAVLIFDEVITGFRVALGGAAEMLGVTPDLAVYGKALGSGWPVAAIAGLAEVMQPAASGRALLAGTFNGNLMSAAAAVATIRHLMSDPPYERITEAGEALKSGLVALGHEYGIPLRVQGPPAVFHASMGMAGEVYSLADLESFDREAYRRFALELTNQGVWVSARGSWFLSSEHSPSDIDTTLRRVGQALERFVARPT